MEQEQMEQTQEQTQNTETELEQTEQEQTDLEAQYLQKIEELQNSNKALEETIKQMQLKTFDAALEQELKLAGARSVRVVKALINRAEILKEPDMQAAITKAVQDLVKDRETAFLFDNGTEPVNVGGAGTNSTDHNDQFIDMLRRAAGLIK